MSSNCFMRILRVKGETWKSSELLAMPYVSLLVLTQPVNSLIQYANRFTTIYGQE
jgi:hypothetical protein